jgi:hypothetical protein
MRPKTMRTNRIRKCMVAGAVATALTLSACSLAPNTGPNTSPSTQTNARGPVTTTDGDWKPVADALGRTGKLGDNNTAYRGDPDAQRSRSRPTVSPSSPVFRLGVMPRSRGTTTTRPC